MQPAGVLQPSTSSSSPSTPRGQRARRQHVTPAQQQCACVCARRCSKGPAWSKWSLTLAHPNSRRLCAAVQLRVHQAIWRRARMRRARRASAHASRGSHAFGHKLCRTIVPMAALKACKSSHGHTAMHWLKPHAPAAARPPLYTGLYRQTSPSCSPSLRHRALHRRAPGFLQRNLAGCRKGCSPVQLPRTAAQRGATPESWHGVLGEVSHRGIHTAAAAASTA